MQQRCWRCPRLLTTEECIEGVVICNKCFYGRSIEDVLKEQKENKFFFLKRLKKNNEIQKAV